MGWVGAVAQCALDFLAPERCHACGASPHGAAPGGGYGLDTPVEVASFASITLTTRVLCAACALKVRRHDRTILVAGRSGEPLPVRAAFITDERLLAVIHLLKFGRRERLAPWLARAMLPVLPPPASGVAANAVMIPVPMDRAARRRRGFNQAESIARILATAWELPVSTHALVKVRRTRAQSALGRDERLLNLEGAFRADATHVRGRLAILVDDLVTTGATVHACATALRRAGAAEVAVICAGYRDDAVFLQS